MHNRNNPYTPISAKLINNTELTGEERFLLIYLLGRSDDYILNSSYFAHKSQDLFGWGRDKFQNIWNILQDKGYIVKEQMRDKGRVAGCHYKVNEVLKNRCPENPGSGKSVSRQTSALPSIDKPIIDKPIKEGPNGAAGTTKTNPNGSATRSRKPALKKRTTLIANPQVQELFDLICERNPSEHSDNWKMNDQDLRLIEDAIEKLGFEGAQIKIYMTVGRNDNHPYHSASYIFSDINKEEDIESFLKERPECIEGMILSQLEDHIVEAARIECKNNRAFYDFLKKAISHFHKEAKHWTPSEKDLEHCLELLYSDSNIEIAAKLRGGLKSAILKQEWRFGQIVYQAISAIETREVHYP